jgi:hypothetical protein
MTETEELKIEITKLKARNEQVEAEKAWETSKLRKIIIAILTYLVIVLFFYFAKLSRPFINAIVPTIGFILSTLSTPLFKKLWIKQIYKK